MRRLQRFARARPVRRAWNKSEAAYGQRLDALRAAGEIVSWQYESVKFRLGTKTWYTPDFLVIANDGTIELHEVKGWMRDDAAVKIKAAASQYPMFRFVVCRKNRAGWQIDEVPARPA